MQLSQTESTLPVLPVEIVMMIFSWRPQAAVGLNRELTQWAISTVNGIHINMEGVNSEYVRNLPSWPRDIMRVKLGLYTRGEYTEGPVKHHHMYLLQRFRLGYMVLSAYSYSCIRGYSSGSTRPAFAMVIAGQWCVSLNFEHIQWTPPLSVWHYESIYKRASIGYVDNSPFSCQLDKSRMFKLNIGMPSETYTYNWVKYHDATQTIDILLGWPQATVEWLHDLLFSELEVAARLIAQALHNTELDTIGSVAGLMGWD